MPPSGGILLFCAGRNPHLIEMFIKKGRHPPQRMPSVLSFDSTQPN
jgi:hypothetical protein